MSSTIAVTATVQDPSSTSLTGNCFVRFRLRNFAGFVPQVNGTSILPEIQVDAVPTAGAISQNLWPNNAITPSTTFYTVELWNQGRITSSGNYIFNTNTSLNSASQVNAPPVPAGFSLVLENNGALNSSQSTLNLESTDASVTITDLGNGNINLQGQKAASFSTSGQGWFVGPGIMDVSCSIAGLDAPITNYSANQVLVQQFSLSSSWKLSKVSYKLNTTQASSHFNFGIYDANGNKLIDSGAFDGSISTAQTNSFTAVTLPPGTYYFAASATSGSFQGPALQLGTVIIADFVAIMNAGASPFIATAANSTSGNVMPSTLGTLTGVNTGTFQTFPLCVWRV